MTNSPATKFKFDINHDGKIDSIVTSYQGIHLVPLKSQQQLNNRPMGLDGSNDGQKPVTKGDINGDGVIDQNDITDLSFALGFTDINFNGKIDEEDYKVLKEALDYTDPLPFHPIREGPGWFLDLNHDGQISKKDLCILDRVLKAGDMDGDGIVNNADMQILKNQINSPPPSPECMLSKFANSMLEHNGDFRKVSQTAFAELMNSLAEKTGISIDRRRASALGEFFSIRAFGINDGLNFPQPFNAQGIKNLKAEDVIKFWIKPELPNIVPL